MHAHDYNGQSLPQGLMSCVLVIVMSQSVTIF